jgi:uncharacterized protein
MSWSGRTVCRDAVEPECYPRACLASRAGTDETLAALRWRTVGVRTSTRCARSTRQWPVAGNEVDPESVQTLLDALPGSLEAPDVVMLDGFLCGVILRPAALVPGEWMPFALDVEGRAPPRSPAIAAAQRAVSRRHAALHGAIERRQWFDPWIYELDADAPPGDAVFPWVAGFAMAAQRWPLPLDRRTPTAREVLALLYQYLDPSDWPEAAELTPEIELIEPPAALGEAVEDLVRATLLLADLVGQGGPAPRARRAASDKPDSPPVRMPKKPR